MISNFDAIKDTHLQMAKQRGRNKTYCPSEVAKSVFGPEWREHMDVVREVADKLVADNKLNVLQKGLIVTHLPTKAKGPIRLQSRGQGKYLNKVDMDFEIIDTKKIIVSDGSEVRVYDKSGKRLHTKVPSLKMFIEMAYIHLPVILSSESFETAVGDYLKKLNTNDNIT